MKVFRKSKFHNETFGEEKREILQEVDFYTSAEWLAKKILEREKDADGVEIHLVYRLMKKGDRK
jgi:hypothetical protein